MNELRYIIRFGRGCGLDLPAITRYEDVDKATEHFLLVAYPQAVIMTDGDGLVLRHSGITYATAARLAKSYAENGELAGAQ